MWSFKPNGAAAFTHYETIDDALVKALKPNSERHTYGLQQLRSRWLGHRRAR